MSRAAALRHTTAYSCTRKYTVQNLRFGKQASVIVRMTSRPGQGKQFSIMEHSGAERLIAVIGKLLASEAEASRPATRGEHEIGPSNYTARFRGRETMSGYDCLVLDLTPRSKSKYLVNATVWVDKTTFGIVRLDGTTAASVSVWVGSPHVVEDFVPVSAIWVPVHNRSTSTSMLLGESRLDIAYFDYDMETAEAKNGVR